MYIAVDNPFVDSHLDGCVLLGIMHALSWNFIVSTTYWLWILISASSLWLAFCVIIHLNLYHNLNLMMAGNESVMNLSPQCCFILAQRANHMGLCKPINWFLSKLHCLFPNHLFYTCKMMFVYLLEAEVLIIISNCIPCIFLVSSAFSSLIYRGTHNQCCPWTWRGYPITAIDPSFSSGVPAQLFSVLFLHLLLFNLIDCIIVVRQIHACCLFISSHIQPSVIFSRLAGITP